MGLFQTIFGRLAGKAGSGALFQTLTGYRPVFTTRSGELYESELIRAAIDAKARHASKMQVTLTGTSRPKLRSAVRSGASPWQTWGQFLYRVSTILDMQNTAFIVPILDEMGMICGYFPALPSQCEVVDVGGEPWLRYKFAGGETGAMEMRACGILTKYQYKDDFFGEGNSALASTLDLIDLQRQGIAEGVRNSATIRFIAKTTNFAKAEDLAKERERFTRENMSGNGGVLLFPNTYSDIRQVDSKPYTPNADQLSLIQTNVYNYFGVNGDILQNKAFGDAWAAFYEGSLEPFAVQLSDVMTRMTFSDRERAAGSGIFITSNRLQYMSNGDKLRVSTQMADRGLMTINEVREIWNLPPVEGGDRRVIRGEYYDAEDKTMQEDEEVEDSAR